MSIAVEETFCFLGLGLASLAQKGSLLGLLNRSDLVDIKVVVLHFLWVRVIER